MDNELKMQITPTPQTVRSYDVADLLANLQKQSQAAAPTASPYFVGNHETPKIKETETDTIITPGPPYACGATVLCGFASVTP
jgi:hypothetical protein